jgi:hypothetical protein
MGWFKAEKKEPLLSEWDRYTFVPREDITTYELALIVSTHIEYGTINHKKPWKHWPDVMRHFKFMRTLEVDEVPEQFRDEVPT